MTTGRDFPAIVIQTTFLAANIAFLLAGHNDWFILGSITILMIIFIIQTTSKNERFWWLFPGRKAERIPTPAYDTWILRLLIVAAVALFYIGATKAYGWPVALLVIAILLIAGFFPKAWDKWLNDRNENEIAERVIAGQKTMKLYVMEIRPNGNIVICGRPKGPRGRMSEGFKIIVKPPGSYAGLTYEELLAHGVGEITFEEEGLNND